MGICRVCGDETGDGSDWCAECWKRLSEQLIE